MHDLGLIICYGDASGTFTATEMAKNIMVLTDMAIYARLTGIGVPGGPEDVGCPKSRAEVMRQGRGKDGRLY